MHQDSAIAAVTADLVDSLFATIARTHPLRVTVKHGHCVLCSRWLRAPAFVVERENPSAPCERQTGFALGQDTITVTVTDASGNPIPGATETGSIQIGTPVTVSLTTSPSSLPQGSGTVTTTLQINSQSTFASPLGLVGATSISSASGVAVSGSFAYVGSGSGIDVVDVSNPTTPVVLSTYGSSDFPGMSVVALEVSSGNLVALVQNIAGDAESLLIYSLANPSSPTLLGQTPITTRPGLQA